MRLCVFKCAWDRWFECVCVRACVCVCVCVCVCEWERKRERERENSEQSKNFICFDLTTTLELLRKIRSRKNNFDPLFIVILFPIRRVRKWVRPLLPPPPPPPAQESEKKSGNNQNWTNMATKKENQGHLEFRDTSLSIFGVLDLGVNQSWSSLTSV